MGNFEDLCSAIAKGLPPETSAERHQRVRDLRESPAVRLALDRSQARNGPTSKRLLYDLVRKYANNECERPCDHVYALYNLIGEHRSQLEVQYSLGAAKRFKDVMNFMHQAENIPATEVIETASCLAQLFRLDEDDFHGLTTSAEEFLPISVSIFGHIRLIPESNLALAARDRIKRLIPMAIYHFQEERGGSKFQNVSPDLSFQQDIGARDMLHFTCPYSSILGLASCRMQDGDKIWHMENTKLGFVVRDSSSGGYTIIGRAYVIHTDKTLPTATTLTQWPALSFADLERKIVYVDIPTMFQLKSLANGREECIEEDREAREARMKELVDEHERQLKSCKLMSAALTNLLVECETVKQSIDVALCKEAEVKCREDAEFRAKLSSPRPSRKFGGWFSKSKDYDAHAAWERGLERERRGKYAALRKGIWQKWASELNPGLLWTTLTLKQDKRFWPADLDPSIRNVLVAYLSADAMNSPVWTPFLDFSDGETILSQVGIEEIQSTVEMISISSRKVKDIIDHGLESGTDPSELIARITASLQFSQAISTRSCQSQPTLSAAWNTLLLYGRLCYTLDIPRRFLETSLRQYGLTETRVNNFMEIYDTFTQDTNS
jgi:hypothetical protein